MSITFVPYGHDAQSRETLVISQYMDHGDPERFSRFVVARASHSNQIAEVQLVKLKGRNVWRLDTDGASFDELTEIMAFITDKFGPNGEKLDTKTQ